MQEPKPAFTMKLGPGKSRVPSTIQFPYTDISDGLAVADGLLKGGGLALSRDQLAAAMGLAPNGGGFATKVATAKAFGIVESQGGKYQLTDLGHEIADPGRRAEAMVAAFLSVELYKKVYDEFRGRRLPPRPAGIEAAFVNFGVSPKNASTARLAFDKSARAAGFFPNGDEDRLVMPFTVQGPAPAEPQSQSDPSPQRYVSAPEPVAKPLHYQLVDLLTEGGVGDEETAAIWTLVRFLTAKNKTV